jgi:hypothetical protein
MKTYREAEVYYASLTSALMEVSGKFHALAALPLGKESPLPNKCA